MPASARQGGPARTPAAAPPRKLLIAIDAALTERSRAGDVRELTAAATAAVRAGRGHVLSASHTIFGNGAVTLVLILAESHLAIHTWPEENLIAIDLFSCGAIDAARVAGELVRSLRLVDVRTQQVERGARAPAC